jgi:hypothetical protein
MRSGAIALAHITTKAHQIIPSSRISPAACAISKRPAALHVFGKALHDQARWLSDYCDREIRAGLHVNRYWDPKAYKLTPVKVAHIHLLICG